MSKIIVRHIDDPDPLVYDAAPEDIARAIQRRFESRPVAIHPTKPNVFIYDPGNFWDGPTHVTWEPETGMFAFENYGGPEHFPLHGPLQ
jgi:hypothetical protein